VPSSSNWSALSRALGLTLTCMTRIGFLGASFADARLTS
jgi:hypothetical protein